MDTHYLILGRDLNCVMDTQLDCFSSKVTITSKIAMTLKSFMEDCGSCDVWRSLHQDAKEYSFFSHVHHMYLRIDYFFIDKILLQSVHSSEYSAIVISDHAPILA